MMGAERNLKWRKRHLTAVRKMMREYMAAWRKKHPILARRLYRKYRGIRKPELDNARHRKYFLCHPEVRVACENRRRARKRRAGGSYTAGQWLSLKLRTGSKCLRCGRSEQELKRRGLKLVPDHVKPLAFGGRNDIQNLQPLCHGAGGCNNRKSAKFIDYRRK